VGFFGCLSGGQRRQINFDWLCGHSLEHHLLEECLVSPEVDSLRSEMTGGEVLATGGEVNRQGDIFELDPVNERASNDIPHADTLVHRTADQPFSIRL